MFIGWLTCIPAVLLPHSLRRFTTANAPANRQMPIASVVMGHSKKKEKRPFGLISNALRLKQYDFFTQTYKTKLLTTKKYL
jgi:hypothetical protein